jgi:uncharacterized membrane-anchored protein
MGRAMRLPTRHKPLRDLPGVAGTARVDRRTGALVPRLQSGDIAVIDHLDLDREHAEALVDSGVVAVVNASSFISGRYPNLGPDLLARSGVLMLDQVGPQVFSAVRDGSPVRVVDGELLVGERPVASGRELSAEDVESAMQDARGGLATQLQSFTHNTTEFLRREPELLLHGQGLPRPRTDLRDRPVVVVVRGYDYREDLRLLHQFIREQRPVLVGVDAGVEALLAAGHRVDVAVVGDEALLRGGAGGDRDAALSDASLRAAREVVLHSDRAGGSPGKERLDRLALPHQVVAASGTSEDMALLLADVSGASLIVTAGTHASLDEFLDRQRAGLASTFLTRLRVGPKLVDAKGVPQLYAGRVRLWELLIVVLTGFVALAAAIAATPAGDQWWSATGSDLLTPVGDAWSHALDWIQGLFS